MARNDLTAQTRIDMRYLATIAEYYNSKGAIGQIRSMSALVRESLEQFSWVVENNGARKITSTEEAQEILGSLGLLPNYTTARGKYNHALNIQEQSLQEDGFDPRYATQRKTLKDEPINEDPWKEWGKLNKLNELVQQKAPLLPKEDIEEGVRMYNQIMRNQRLQEERLNKLKELKERDMESQTPTTDDYNEQGDVESIEEALTRRAIEDQLRRDTFNKMSKRQ